jgi:hypothetical protein
VEPPDIGALLCLCATANPFITREAIVERTVVDDGIGLLVGAAPPSSTLLYLVRDHRADFLPWLTHVSRWVALYPAWLAAHGRTGPPPPVRIVLAGPQVSDGLRDAVALISCPVLVAGYRVGTRGGEPFLEWEQGAVLDGADGEHRADRSQTVEESWQVPSDEALTSEEWEFFRRFASR